MNRRTKLIFAVSAVLIIALAVVILLAVFYPRGPAGAPDGGGTAIVKKDKDRDKGRPKEPPFPDTLTLGFYNVENLFDFNLDGGEYNEYKPGWYGWTEEVQRKKLEGTAEVIAAFGADVIGLCEVENMNVIKELQTLLDRMGAPYPYAAAADAPKSATVTALISKLPIREKIDYPVDKSRPILEAVIARGGDEFRVFVNHWPSKRHKESARLAAAEILRRRVDRLPPGTDYVIMGDLNSNHDEYASFHTAGFNDTEGRTGINHVLRTVAPGPRASSPYRFFCKGELPECGDCHYNPWLDIAEDGRRSYVFRGANQTIDHILLPPSMFDTLGYSYIGGTFEVFTWDGRLLRDNVPYRWQMVFRGKQRYHVGKGYSDHLPVRARFVRASVLYGDTASTGNDNCDAIDPNLVRGDFAVSVDGWMSGDARFVVARDSRFARTGTHSLRVSGMHETENRTAARVRLQASASNRFLTMSARGEGRLSVRLRRPEGKWVYYNAPGFAVSKSAKYNDWKSGTWTNLKFALPEPVLSPNEDVEVELRAGKGEKFSVWVDRVRLE
ncbi:MAG: endonuclease/exonuclease/phosphatase family protein [Chitinispirillia bacterium]|nr:endonuclease/exonuclease/phosphatase family protein [Chitinispirillia bacterium]MCL2267619.1 endonuclease/exonuclease/phosphatase family protein [Chitinispirillia bacterium]